MSAVVIACGVGWGALAAMPIVDRIRTQVVVSRFDRPETIRTVPRLRWDGGPVGRVVRGLVWRRRQRVRDQQLLEDLPTVLDLLGVAIGAGATPRGALESAARWGPENLGVHLRRVAVSADLGGSFADALRLLADEMPCLAPVADVLLASAQLGSPAGAALARLGDETRSTLRRAAEARARTLPVKLLFPLVFLVLPAFGLLTVVPAILSALQRL